ncbi:hypothetical protein Cni_G05049 [Canna indica]|uniref:Protein ROS1 n=1 Tax=Canna indica TaxID=4628 RepID=A0AAQ3JUI6_9LILI|nr:hypothetical protein Cni_G05049 [Canna indica]
MDHFDHCHGLPASSHNLGSGMVTVGDLSDGWQQATHANLMAHAEATAVANKTPFFMPLMLSQIDGDSRTEFAPDQLLMGGKMLLNSSVTNFDLNLITQINNSAPTLTSLLKETINIRDRVLMPQYPSTPASLQKNNPVQNHSPPVQNKIIFSEIDDGSRMMFTPDQSMMNGHMLYSSNLTNLDLNLRMRYGSANNPAPTFTSLLEETIIMSNKDMMCQYPQMSTSLENIKPVQNYLPSAQNNIMFSQTDGCSRMAFAPDQSLMNGNMLLDLNLSNFDLNVRAQNELPNNSTPSLTSLLEERINIGNRDLTPQYPMTPANLEKNRPVNHSPPEFIDLVDDSRNDKSNWEGAWQSTTKRAKLCYLEPLATSPMAPAIPVPMGTPLPFKAALIEQQQTYIEEAVSSAEAIDQTVNAATQGLLENSGIDPNKTPQQKPKRKKHRPKVIREAKPARTPKPATPKSANPSGKRKYIRRNKAQVSVETPTSEPGNSNGKGVDSSQKRAYVQKKNDENSSHGSYSNATGTGVPVSRCGIKSVRRRLNFESDAPDSLYGYPGSMPSQAQNACCGRNIIKIDAGVSVHHSGVQQAVGNLIAGVPFDICSSTNQVPNEHMRFAEKNSISHFRPCRTDIMRTNQILDEFRSGKIQEHPAIHPQPSKRENLRRWERKRFPGITPNLDIDRYQEPDTVQQFISASEHIHDNNAQIMMDENLMQESDRIEKLDQSHIAYYNDAYLSQIYKKQGRDQGTYLSDIDGWKRHQVAMDTAEACTLDDVKNQLASEGMLEFDQPENITVNRSCLTLTPLSQTSVSSREEFNHTTKPGNHSGQVAMGQNKQSDPLQPFSSNYIQHNNNHETITCLERQVSRTKSRKNKSQTFIHLTNTDQVGLKGQKASSHNLECFPHQKITEVTTLALQDFREVSNTTNLNSGVLVPYRDPLSLKTGVVVPYQDPLDDVMQKLRHLTVNESCHAETVEEQNAIISYSANGSMIPYEGPFDLTRKSRPRPKVDLDPETNRVWNLLMGNQGEGVNETDADKEKWWEEERRVFRGRVDSFIARMHLVQGDRRFSKWKGSVVDSVVGVFLTQNVSDHLSSSAFMALAARFPMKSRCKSTESSAEERDLCIKNEDGNTTTLEDTSKWQEQTSDQELHGSTALVIVENEIANSNESFGSNSSFIVANYLKDKCVNSKEKVMGISQHSPDSQSSTPVTLTRSIYVAEVEDRWSVEDAGSSQNSSENPGQIGISSLSNITVEDLTIPTVCPGMDNFTSFTELLNSVLDVSDYTHSGFPERRNGSNSGNMKSSREHTSNNSEVIRQHNFAVISGSPPTVNLFKQTCKNFIRRQASPEAEPYPTKQFPSPSPLQPDLNEAPLPESVSQKFSLLSDGCTVKFQQEERVIRNKGTKQAVKSQLQKQSFDSQQNSPNLHNMNLLETSKIIKLHLEDNAYISRKLSAETPKRKRKEKMVKNENERNKTYDWDSLRKEVGLDGRKEERSHDTMDSVDWEAVRCAEVDEISHTIKERGMNNILAGRIKVS